jgi:3-deoxy-D-manno-octulosonate 8-phosphate phosphatase KdsC-like HAD superfamily phosphatase
MCWKECFPEIASGKTGKPVKVRREPVAVTGDNLNDLPLIHHHPAAFAARGGEHLDWEGV